MKPIREVFTNGNGWKIVVPVVLAYMTLMAAGLIHIGASSQAGDERLNERVTATEQAWGKDIGDMKEALMEVRTIIKEAQRNGRL